MRTTLEHSSSVRESAARHPISAMLVIVFAIAYPLVFSWPSRHTGSFPARH
jgi:hypothetical protein